MLLVPKCLAAEVCIAVQVIFLEIKVLLDLFVIIYFRFKRYI
jgi:hypothetical protein